MDARLAFAPPFAPSFAGVEPPIYPPPRLPQQSAPTDPERLVAAHLGLVRKIAWHVHARVSTAIDIEDLIQIGMIALIEASRAFEDRGQAAFATYATVRVRGSMIDQLRKSATLVRSAIKKRREFGAAQSILEGLLGRAPTDEEMALQLDTTVAAYRTAAAATHAVRYESIDDVYSDHSDWFADAAPSAFDDLASADLKRAIAAAVGELPPREALVLQLYYVEELNLEEIGQVLDVGPARVCQIKKAALGRLRGKLTVFEED
jgi:RNA polymerase sigma factor for flagellar operon FliA